MPTFNGRVWSLADFSPYGFASNFVPFFQDVLAELAIFAGSGLRDQAAASAASAATSAQLAAASAGAAGTGTATGLVYGAAVKNLVTAADVVALHVYDTARDSDGGAWTQRCRGASWYNEALNTATRGATRRFPRVALIVVRAASVTIYDAHDLDGAGAPRMWMVFNVGGASWAAANVLAEAGNAVHATNGRVWLTSAAGTYGMVEIDFLGDRAYRRSGSGGYGGRYRGGTLAARNATGGYMQDLTAGQALAATACTAVHARVLPGAPLDSAGLSIPTVAVATAGGVSIIHPWGAVCDITGLDASRVLIRPNGSLLVAATSSTAVRCGPMIYADVAVGSWVLDVLNGTSSTPRLPPTSVAALADAAVGTLGSGLVMWADEPGRRADSMVSYHAIDYCTGWMPGDIRGAYLCGVATGSVAATTVLSETFASATAWTLSVGSHDGGNGEVDFTTATGNITLTAGLTGLVVGQTYVVEAVVNALSAGTVAVQVPSGTAIATASTAGTIIGQFVATAATSSLRFALTGATGSITSVVVRAGTADRSHKGKGLAVVGTGLIRAAVATGTDLVAWSGWSGTSYLEQPGNPDLDPGTGDILLRAWVLLPAGAAGGAVMSRSTPAGANPSMFVNVSATLLFRARLDGANEVNVSAAIDIRGTGWRCVTALRTGTSYELWLDDVRVANATATAHNLSNATGVMRIGQRTDTDAPFAGGSITLARIGVYAPSPAQIRRMFVDELAMMQPGAKSMLGGTSNIVGALAMDGGAGVLHVGTDDGVSSFNGLVRTGYLDATNASPSVASDTIRAVAAGGGQVLIGTAANAGWVTDSLIARDALSLTPAALPAPAANAMHCAGVTTDATPLVLSPRLYVGEREVVSVRCDGVARMYGATATESAIISLSARFVRDAGGALTLATEADSQGGVRWDSGTPGAEPWTDKTAGALAAALVVSDGVIGVQVTGIAATRIEWVGVMTWTRIARDLSYAA